MIEFKLFFALISYYFVMFATPGPNNAMLTASGIKFGFKRTLPHMVGIPFGHIIQITLVCFGLGSLFQRYPNIQFYLKWLCFVYLLYLGWKIIGSFSNSEKETGRPLKFYEAALFQFPLKYYLLYLYFFLLFQLSIYFGLHQTNIHVSLFYYVGL